MVDNFDLIIPHLKWRSADDFYFIQVIQRKKDYHDRARVNGTNNNARLVKAYYVSSLEQLEFYRPEIIELCNIFNARAGINLNRRSYEKTHMKFLKKVVDQMENKSFEKAYKAYPSVVGANAHDNDKRWIVDIDKAELPFIEEIKLALSKCDPNSGENKVLVEIPSKTGIHLITSPFNRASFPNILNTLLEPYQVAFNLDVQPNNPTNLFIT